MRRNVAEPGESRRISDSAEPDRKSGHLRPETLALLQIGDIHHDAAELSDGHAGTYLYLAEVMNWLKVSHQTMTVL